jgi:hypothetical protein
MDALEKFEVYAEQTVFDLDEARSKFAVEAVSIEVMKDSIKKIKKKRKRKKWGGDRKSTRFIAMEFATKDDVNPRPGSVHRHSLHREWCSSRSGSL